MKFKNFSDYRFVFLVFFLGICLSSQAQGIDRQFFGGSPNRYSMLLNKLVPVNFLRVSGLFNNLAVFSDCLAIDNRTQADSAQKTTVSLVANQPHSKSNHRGLLLLKIIFPVALAILIALICLIIHSLRKLKNIDPETQIREWDEESSD